MKKLLVVAVVLSAFIYNSQAQTKFGVKAGFLNLSAKIEVDDEGSFSDSEAGFFIGGVVDIEINESFSIQPELLYGNVDENSLLYIPILAKFDVSETGLYFLGGPQATLDLEESIEGYNNFGIDLTAGLGYSITENFFVDARYAFEVTNRIEDAPDGVSARLNSLLVGIGYKF